MALTAKAEAFKYFVYRLLDTVGFPCERAAAMLTNGSGKK